MLKQLLAFILLGAFAVQTFNQGMIVYSFYANQDAAKKLCVNKARPQMHCNGKCQLMKKIQQQEKNDKENSDRKPENKTDLVFLKLSSAKIYFTLIEINTPSFEVYQDVVFDNYPGNIFHPPQI